MPKSLRVRLALFAGGERDRADLRHALDDMRDIGAEQLVNPFNRRQRVFDDVVQEAGGNGHHVQLEVDKELGDGEGVDQVRFA